MPEVCAIVVTFNGKQWLDRCLGSLQVSTIPLHTIVVDNASSDGTPEYIEQTFPNVELIRSDKNLGFGKGNNLGLKRALEEKADSVLLLNQDAWIKPNTVKELLKIQNDHIEFGILSPVHLEADGKRLEKHFSRYASPGYCNSFISDSYLNTLEDIYETKFVNAACWLIRTDVLEEIGVFDPLFDHYGEDEDLVHRLHYFNYKIGIVPNTIIYHDINNRTWEQLFWDVGRQKIFAFIQLKNINTTLKSAAFMYFKNQLDASSTSFFTRRFKKSFYYLKIMVKVLTYIPKINRARKISKRKGAFLYA